MSEQYTDDNSLPNQHQKKNSSKQNIEQGKNKEPQHTGKSKRGKKTTASKVNTERIQNKPDNQSSIGKQVKLTELWKCNTNTSQSVPKYMNNSQLYKKKIQEEIQEKNKQILKLKAQRDNIQRNYSALQIRKNIYQQQARQTIKKTILQLTKANRFQKYKANPKYGNYYKDQKGSIIFMEGPYTKQIRQIINQKNESIKQVQSQYCVQKKDKQLLQFRERYLLKEIDQLKKILTERQAQVNEYRQRLKFGQTEYCSYFSRAGWPAVGDDQRFQVLELLGSGGYGQVYKCYDLQLNSYAAIKLNRFTSNKKTAKQQQLRQNFLKHVRRQIQILKQLNHPNIAKLVQILKIQQSQVSFVMQYCQGPQLSKYLKKNKFLQQKQAKLIIKQVLCALKYLYEQDNKVIHFDLKPSNIMFHKGIVKILDFGLCKEMETEETKMNLTSQGVGTYWYLPPEAFESQPIISSKLDIWSVGVIFFQLLYGKKPFGNGVKQQLIWQKNIILKAEKVDFPEKSQKGDVKFKVSDSAKKFICQLLKYNQQQRLSPLQAYQHEYFK